MKFPFGRRRTVLVRALLGAALASASVSLQAADIAAGEVDHMLQFVRDSSCTFIRNGSDHTSAEAADHIAMKAKHAGVKVNNGDTLIDLVASKSSITGQPYYVQCPGAAKTESATWLHQELNRYRASQATAALVKP